MHWGLFDRDHIYRVKMTMASGVVTLSRAAVRLTMQIYLSSQCPLGELHPELYKSGFLAMEMGVEAGPQMTPECAVVKMMLCLCYPDIPLGVPLAGEL
jgi:L-asparaginase/Glu-tRNA(Gln) amidotransferase subunit D